MALTIPYFAAQVMEKASLISQLVWLTLSVLFLSYDSVLVEELGYLDTCLCCSLSEEASMASFRKPAE